MVDTTPPFTVETTAASPALRGIVRSTPALVTAGAVELIRDETLTERWEGENRTHVDDNMWEGNKENKERSCGTGLPVCCFTFLLLRRWSKRSRLYFPSLQHPAAALRGSLGPVSIGTNQHITYVINFPRSSVFVNGDEPGVHNHVLSLKVTGFTRC